MRRQINSNELAHLFHRIGSAIWHLQNVEGAIVPFIIIKGMAQELGTLTENEGSKLEAQFNKLTLGQLIRELENKELLEYDYLIRVKAFNKERKWIVHNSVRESGDNLYTENGRNDFFDRIESFIDEAINLHKLFGNLLTEYAVSKGANLEEINQTVESELRKLKGT